MKREIEIETGAGKARAGLFLPPAGPEAPGVLFYTDAMGPRPALDAMAGELAAAGYTVLMPDLFWRSVPYGPFTGAAFRDETSRKAVLRLIRATPASVTRADGGFFLDRLAAEGALAPFGVVGYCFGGGRALAAAAAYPDRIAAAASFHGGNLASDAPDSPHLAAAAIRARVYVGEAGVDASFPPEQSARLAGALRAAGVDHVIENYVGMAHGWTVPDSPVHDPVGAARHWKRLLGFFEEVLPVAR
jgi:carboxymethylenebutenolidase